MLKNCKTVMLPTNEKAPINLTNQGLLFNSPDYIGKNQHLYILSDDEIKVGDYTIDNDGNLPFQIHANIVRYKQGKYPKIIASTDSSLNLPSPSQAFIEKYCEVGGIDEVLVKYEVTPISDYAMLKLGVFMDNRFWTLGDPALIPNSFWLKSNDGTTENTSGSGYVLGEDIEVTPKTKNNQITIKPIKNHFTRLELIVMLDKFQATKLTLEQFVELYM
jgi:hypothetical protein